MDMNLFEYQCYCNKIDTTYEDSTQNDQYNEGKSNEDNNNNDVIDNLCTEYTNKYEQSEGVVAQMGLFIAKSALCSVDYIKDSINESLNTIDEDYIDEDLNVMHE